MEGLRKTMRNLNQDSRLLGPRIEPGTSQIRSRRFNYSTTMFGGIGPNFMSFVKI
jgi:hypothetical protein